jgi:hypothetical protein
MLGSFTKFGSTFQFLLKVDINKGHLHEDLHYEQKWLSLLYNY